MSEIEVDENVVLRIEDKPEHHIEPHILGNSMEVEDLAENVVSLGSVPTKSGLLFIEDVPEYHKQPHILRGYRPETHSRWDMFRSIFAVHNETGNIWTHLVPAGYFLVVAAQFGLEMAGHPEWPHWYECTLLIGLIGATDYMLFASVAYHACKSGDEQTCTCMLARDQGGIVILVASSYVTGIALGFRCLPTLRIVYLLYTGAVVLLLSTPLLRPNLISRKLVKPLFIFCVSIGLVPGIHFVCEARGAEVFLVVPYLLSMFGCYATGAMFLLSHWPEKSYPGQFDFVGSSHQLWPWPGHQTDESAAEPQLGGSRRAKRRTQSDVPNSVAEEWLACCSEMQRGTLCSGQDIVVMRSSSSMSYGSHDLVSFTAKLQRDSTNTKMGLVLDIQEGAPLHIEEVHDGSPVSTYNSTAPPMKVIAPGYYIEAVDGECGSATSLVSKMMDKLDVELQIRRPFLWDVMITRSSLDSLGIKFSKVAKFRPLVVRQVNKGPVMRWNARQHKSGRSELSVRRGDRIIHICGAINPAHKHHGYEAEGASIVKLLLSRPLGTKAAEVSEED